MKYKHISGALHNFAHSFLSLMNSSDDVEYIEDIVYWLAVQSEQWMLTIDFSTGHISPEQAARNTPLRESVERWRHRLPDLLRSHRIDPARLGAITLHVQMHRREHLPEIVDLWIQALDDRGRLHRVDLPRRYPYPIGRVLPCFDYRGW